MSEIFYHENQHMLPTVWIAAITLLMLVIEIVAILSYYGNIDLGRPTDAVGLCIVTAIVVAVDMLALFLRMDVTVTDEGISVGTIKNRFIPKEDIESLGTRDRIRAICEYGGWGIRMGAHGIGYIVPGNKGGLEVRVKDKKLGFLVSSRDPQSLYDAASKLLRCFRRRGKDDPQ